MPEILIHWQVPTATLSKILTWPQYTLFSIIGSTLALDLNILCLASLYNEAFNTQNWRQMNSLLLMWASRHLSHTSDIWQLSNYPTYKIYTNANSLALCCWVQFWSIFLCIVVDSEWLVSASLSRRSQDIYWYLP